MLQSPEATRWLTSRHADSSPQPSSLPIFKRSSAPQSRHSERSAGRLLLPVSLLRALLHPARSCGLNRSACGCEDRRPIARLLRDESLLFSPSISSFCLLVSSFVPVSDFWFLVSFQVWEPGG